jgi:hypothetical protein
MERRQGEEKAPNVAISRLHSAETSREMKSYRGNESRGDVFHENSSGDEFSAFSLHAMCGEGPKNRTKERFVNEDHVLIERLIFDLGPGCEFP